MSETTEMLLGLHEQMKRKRGIAASTLWLFSTPTGFAMLCMCLTAAFYLSDFELSPTVGSPSSEELQFGPLAAGTEAEMRIPLCNRGLLPLRLLNVKTGCACLQHSLEKNLVLWRQNTEIILHYSLKGKMPGISREIVSLQTNDWYHPYTEFRVAVQIEGGWRILPNELLVVIRNNEKTTRTVQVLYDGQGVERVVSVRSDNPNVVPTLGKEKVFPLTGRRLFAVSVACNSLFDGHENRGTVLVETNAQKNPALALPVVIRKSDYVPACHPDS